MDLRDAQRLGWANKLRQGFNTTDIDLEFCLLYGEIAEAFTAWRRHLADLDEELADVALFLCSIATMTGNDLQSLLDTRAPRRGSGTVAALFRHLYRDVALASGAVPEGHSRVADGLAGAVSTLLALADAMQIDLVAAVASKVAVNDGRTYVRDEASGVLVRAVPGQ